MRSTIRTLRARTSGLVPMLESIARRMTLAASSAVLWALEGVVDGDGTVERDEAEVFSGIGFYARPKAGDKAEVVVLRIGGESDHGVIIATRNLDGIKRIGTLGEDESIVFNSQVMVKVTAAGEILAGSIGGSFGPLATLADIDALRNWVATHTHGGVTAGGAVTQAPTGAVPPTPLAPPTASGTQKLKAE